MLQIFSIIFLIIYTLTVIFIGIKNSHSKDSSDYFLASRQLPSWLLAITFIASWWGGGSAIDLVDHAYTDGISSFWIYGVPVLLSTFIMAFFAAKIQSNRGTYVDFFHSTIYDSWYCRTGNCDRTFFSNLF